MCVTPFFDPDQNVLSIAFSNIALNNSKISKHGNSQIIPANSSAYQTKALPN